MNCENITLNPCLRLVFTSGFGNSKLSINTEMNCGRSSSMYCTLNLSLSLSLSHTHKHTHNVWRDNNDGLLCKYSDIRIRYMDNTHTTYIIQITFFCTLICMLLCKLFCFQFGLEKVLLVLAHFNTKILGRVFILKIIRWIPSWMKNTL